VQSIKEKNIIVNHTLKMAIAQIMSPLDLMVTNPGMNTVFNLMKALKKMPLLMKAPKPRIIHYLMIIPKMIKMTIMIMRTIIILKMMRKKIMMMKRKKIMMMKKKKIMMMKRKQMMMVTITKNALVMVLGLETIGLALIKELKL
jgi:hypothetical protein